LLKVLIENTVPTYHTKTMSGLIRDIDVMVELLRTRCSDVVAHIEQMGEYSFIQGLKLFFLENLINLNYLRYTQFSFLHFLKY
jgi:hypothetical protein